ncbi:MAG: beta-ketoacyl-[acyl-carrier-protein] synthase family protein [Colwellia sp.]|nr:beta-ketoacyl-[acyl-carrier-protein] synthase family protein [Colwellia sp.]
MMRDVVITGISVCVPQHQNPHHLFDTLQRGQSLISFDERLSEMGIGGVASSAISDEEIVRLKANYPCLDSSKICPSGYAAFSTFNESIKDSGLGFNALNQAGLFFGTNKTLLSKPLLHSLNNHLDTSSSSLSLIDTVNEEVEFYNPQAVIAEMARAHEIDGPIASCADACAAGATSIISGYRRIAHNEIDVAVCGAADFGTQPLMQLIFKNIGALNKTSQIGDATQISRPFDKGRSGVVLADGAAFVVLEEEASARKRGATIYAKIKGAYRCTESHKMTSTDPSGVHYADVMLEALKDAGLHPDQIDHINAHGTSTKSNDQAESQAIATVFGEKVKVTSTKSALGHSLAGSGAVEAVLSVLSLQKQIMLPTLNHTNCDDDDGSINIVNTSTEAPINYMLSNSFGFGGVNTCLVFAKEVKC